MKGDQADRSYTPLSDSERQELMELASDTNRQLGPRCESSDDHKLRTLRELYELAISLVANDFDQPAQAIASYLVGQSTSLDQAFGLIRPTRGRPRSGKTLESDIRVFESRIAGKSWYEIEAETNMDAADARKLFAGSGKFQMRHNDAMAEIIGRRLGTNSPL